MPSSLEKSYVDNVAQYTVYSFLSSWKQTMIVYVSNLMKGRLYLKAYGLFFKKPEKPYA